MCRGKIDSIIKEAVAAQVKQELQEWNRVKNIPKFVGELERMMWDNDELLMETHIHLENS